MPGWSVEPSKKRLLILANLIQAIAVASLPIAHLLAEVTLAQLFIVAVVQGTGGGLTPARLVRPFL